MFICMIYCRKRQIAKTVHTKICRWCPTPNRIRTIRQDRHRSRWLLIRRVHGADNRHTPIGLMMPTMCHGHWPFARNKTQHRAAQFHLCWRPTVSVCLHRIVHHWPICQTMTSRDDFRIPCASSHRCPVSSYICNPFSSKSVIRIQMPTVLTTYQSLPSQSKLLHRRNCHSNYRRHSRRCKNYRTKHLQRLPSKHTSFATTESILKYWFLSFHLQIARLRFTTMAYQR